MAFKLHLRDFGSTCRRCKKRNANISLEVTSRDRFEQQWIGFCQECFDSIAHSIGRAKFVRENPSHASVTEQERYMYGVAMPVEGEATEQKRTAAKP